MGKSFKVLEGSIGKSFANLEEAVSEGLKNIKVKRIGC